jgi:hypothetical protein
MVFNATFNNISLSISAIILNKVVGNGISLSKQTFILSLSLQLNEHCLGRCDHFSDVYCNGERGLPIFEQQNGQTLRL